jgi:hypothetical protein
VSELEMKKLVLVQIWLLLFFEIARIVLGSITLVNNNNRDGIGGLEYFFVCLAFNMNRPQGLCFD